VVGGGQLNLLADLDRGETSSSTERVGNEEGPAQLWRSNVHSKSELGRRAATDDVVVMRELAWGKKFLLFEDGWCGVVGEVG
jgi:hypothetical protein